MDYGAYLRSTSIKSQCAAALFLRAEGLEGAKYLPELLERCLAIDSTKELDRFEEALLRFGALTLGDVVGQLGFDPTKHLHAAILGFLLQSTRCENINVAGCSIHALGIIRPCPQEAVARLCEVVESPLREDEQEQLSLRAFALRTLWQLDPAKSAMFADTPAFQEYADAVELWCSKGASTDPDTRAELQRERSWLRTLGDRRLE